VVGQWYSPLRLQNCKQPVEKEKEAHMCIHIRTHMNLHAGTRAHKHTHTHTHTHTHRHTHAYTHIHTDSLRVRERGAGREKRQRGGRRIRQIEFRGTNVKLGYITTDSTSGGLHAHAERATGQDGEGVNMLVLDFQEQGGHKHCLVNNKHNIPQNVHLWLVQHMYSPV
jgi:hypothetical protein